MGITVGNKEKSIDCTFSGACKCKSQIAECISPVFRDWYDKFLNPNYIATIEDDKLCAYYQDLYHISDDIMEFLFEYTDGTIPSKLVKEIARIIKEDNKDFCIGYVGRNDCAKYQDFKNIFLTSSKHRWIVRFY